MRKRALVVEGGAMRSIFAAGVLDAFMKKDFYEFDMCVGVSAGATTLASYLAGMRGRSYRVIVDYSTSKEFLSLKKYLKGSHYMDLNWLWDHCEAVDPLTPEDVMQRGIDYYIGVTSADTGLVEYPEPTLSNMNDLLKASCALPIIYRHPVSVDGRDYFDGGIAAPIPIKEAIDKGATEIVVIRSRKKEFVMQPSKSKIQEYMLGDFPKVKDAVKKRHDVYNSSIDMIRKVHSGVRIIEATPPAGFDTSRFTMDPKILNKDYKLGLKTGEVILKKL